MKSACAFSVFLPVLPLRVSFRTPECLSADSFWSRSRLFAAALPFSAAAAAFAFSNPSAADWAAQVVYVENVLLGNYLESLGREESQDRGNPSRNRHRLPWPTYYTSVSQLVSQSETWGWVGSYANFMSSQLGCENCSIMLVKWVHMTIHLARCCKFTMSVHKIWQCLGVLRLASEVSTKMKQFGIVRRRLPLAQVVVPLFLAAVVTSFTPCLASQEDVNVQINEIPTGLFTDAEVAEIESVMPLPEAMALIYMGRMCRK